LGGDYPKDENMDNISDYLARSSDYKGMYLLLLNAALKIK